MNVKNVARSRVLILALYSIAALMLFPLSLHLRAAARSAAAGRENSTHTPVLIELFTSEGCSDCPPADALLQKLDRIQPVMGVDLIVLSEHVDYWNDIGWKDPYSSHKYSERQTEYGDKFRLSSIYTPQMVVDGQFQFVGSDEREAIRAIQSAAKTEKIQLMLSSIHFDGANKLSVHLETGPLPSSASAKSANIFLAIADESDESHVTRGENAGRTLKHIAVLRDLIPVGQVNKSSGISQDITLNHNAGDRRDLRLVGIIQESSGGRILGVASARLSNWVASILTKAHLNEI
jgi:hypothetical protein